MERLWRYRQRWRQRRCWRQWLRRCRQRRHQWRPRPRPRPLVICSCCLKSSIELSVCYCFLHSLVLCSTECAILLSASATLLHMFCDFLFVLCVYVLYSVRCSFWLDTCCTCAVFFFVFFVMSDFNFLKVEDNIHQNLPEVVMWRIYVVFSFIFVVCDMWQLLICWKSGRQQTKKSSRDV